MRNTKKAFTLVELIVVITILAILGTIAFISLQGYSADARNSKRTNDLSSISTSITVGSTNGSSLLSFVDGNSAILTNINIAGTGATDGTNYKAGIPNYTALAMKAADFKDPGDDVDYKVGVTTLILGKYELAASMENGTGEKTAKVLGNYNPRGILPLIVATGTGDLASGKFTVGPADINKFFPGDTIVDDNGLSTTILSVSSNGATITMVASTSTGANFVLDAEESDGLIVSTTGTGTTPVTNDSTDLPY